ncbi:uncharacterized protein LOC101740850 isoform X1 [Bombyx mori]|uniref:PXA domain-containing protein n=1 Tax=Bombyx mori TaxID=7091 RepID=A0A8R2GCH1_BOMMO|nr:uncharacterized protein LOC101740850 isoform X1 [Bombyx mori]
MLLRSNLLESVSLVSTTGIVACIVLHALTPISPIGSVWLALYIAFFAISSLFLTIKFIRWLLSLNRPLKYDLERFKTQYPYLNCLWRFLPELEKCRVKESFKEYDTSELSIISTVLEKKLVSSWYVPFISQEISFPFACKQMLDQMIQKSFLVCNKIETRDVFIDICTIFALHLKEYKKALKRLEKSPSESIESFYKKAHAVSDPMKNLTKTDHCTNLLRLIMKELVPWELWDTPHSELIVRILSRKLDSFIDSTLVDPIWLNDKLLAYFKVENKVLLSEKSEPILENIPTQEADTECTKKKTEDECKPEEKKELKAVQIQKKDETINKKEELTSDPVDLKSSPILRQRRGRQGRNEVKIYDRIIEGSVKTWETDMDLQCISLGQDLLASLDGEITLSRLWGQDGSPNPPRTNSPQPLWFGEEDNIDVELSTTPPKERKEHSPKSADALLKDIQSTVSQAKTKIGDLQVRDNLDYKRSDEAAGMMEGLLDFGIAGLKKGLRFTGLSDDSQDKSPSHQKSKQSPEKLGDKIPADFKGRDVSECREAPPFSQNKEDNSSMPVLLKQHRVTSQDSMPSLPRPPPDSPEPQYEEVADLSTSIAKLRSLLQQREQTQRGEEVWWEGAEETRGRTQAHHSSRPVDAANIADEYDMNLDRNSSPGQTSNNMQRLDKLFQRTVTGVFNSIKTAVGAEGEAPVAMRPQHDWVYVCTSLENSVGGAVARLVGARRAFTHVDAALDSLEQLAVAKQEQLVPDDFEEWCVECGAAWSAASAATGAGSPAAPPASPPAHLARRLAAVLAADIFESMITVWLDELTAWLKRQIFLYFEGLSSTEDTAARPKELRNFDPEQTCEVLLQNAGLLQLLGEETLKSSIKLYVSSLSHKELNRDLMFRMLDLFVLHFKKSASIRNPSFDSN